MTASTPAMKRLVEEIKAIDSKILHIQFERNSLDRNTTTLRKARTEKVQALFKLQTTEAMSPAPMQPEPAMSCS